MGFVGECFFVFHRVHKDGTEIRRKKSNFLEKICSGQYLKIMGIEIFNLIIFNVKTLILNKLNLLINHKLYKFSQISE